MAKKKEDAGLMFDIDFDLDFDLDDFDMIDEDMGEPPEPQKRILKARVDRDEIFHKAMFANAEAFADQIDLTPGARTFAWVSGSFIFGDVIEALVTRRNVGIKKLYIATLSISQENIDSLKNVMLMMGDELERLVLVMSGYQYSHEKFGLVPYMYEELDDGTERVQIVFGGWHCKIITIETTDGETITIHGSANLRSSNSVEQVMIEVGAKDLHDFNVQIMEGIADRFGTVNYKAERHQLHRLEGREAWRATQWQADHP